MVSLMKTNTLRIFAVIFIISTLAACDRIIFDYAGIDDPKDAPQYSVEADPTR